MQHTISIKTSERCEFLDITSKIEKAVSAAGVSFGVCRIFVPHTTAALTINENADPSVRRDIIRCLDKLIAGQGDYAHTEGNSPAHIKSSLLGNEKTVFVEAGRLKLGRWQGIFFCEFDGPRERNIWVSISEA